MGHGALHDLGDLPVCFDFCPGYLAIVKAYVDRNGTSMAAVQQGGESSRPQERRTLEAEGEGASQMRIVEDAGPPPTQTALASTRARRGRKLAIVQISSGGRFTIALESLSTAAAASSASYDGTDLCAGQSQGATGWIVIWAHVSRWRVLTSVSKETARALPRIDAARRPCG